MRDLDEGAQDVVMLPAQDTDLIARVRAAARTKALQEEILSRGRVMEDLVYGDPLTRLHNRRFILGRLGSLVAGARRHERPLSIAMIDIDGFKSINDELGHAAGDAALVAVSGRMANRLRREDDLGRLGGEEFLAVLPDTQGQEAARVAEDLRDAVASKPMVVEERSRTVTVSVGWATWDGTETPDALLKRADRALYRAKDSGRNRVCAADAKRFSRTPSASEAQSPAS
jgi:two-component system cell cycle response regulator